METMTTSIILPFLVFFPFLGAVISYIIGRSNGYLVLDFICGDFHCEPNADWEGNSL